jgi:hypothetical protein
LVSTLLLLVPVGAHAAGSGAGATRAAERHTIARVAQFGITLRPADLDIQCSAAGRSRWLCFVYANGGQCSGPLTELFSSATHRYRASRVEIGCGE